MIDLKQQVKLGESFSEDMLARLQRQTQEIMETPIVHSDKMYIDVNEEIELRDQLSKKLIQKNQKDIIKELYQHQMEKAAQRTGSSSKKGYSYSSSSSSGFSGGKGQQARSINDYYMRGEAEKYPEVASVLYEFRSMLRDFFEIVLVQSSLKSLCDRFKMELRFETSQTRAGREGFFIDGAIDRHSQVLYSCEALVSGLRHGKQFSVSKKEAKSKASYGAIAGILMEEEKKLREEGEEIKSSPVYREYFRSFLGNIKVVEDSSSSSASKSNNLSVLKSNYKIANSTVILKPAQKESNEEKEKVNINQISQSESTRNYREELSAFVHKNLRLTVSWMTLLETREMIWQAMAQVGNLSERGFGKTKKSAKNEAAKMLLERCQLLNEKESIASISYLQKFTPAKSSNDNQNSSQKTNKENMDNRLIDTFNQVKGKQLIMNAGQTDAQFAETQSDPFEKICALRK